MTKTTLTVNKIDVKGDEVIVFAKEGCCGGTYKIPLTTDNGILEIGDPIPATKKLIHGLTQVSVYIDGYWIDL